MFFPAITSFDAGCLLPIFIPSVSYISFVNFPGLTHQDLKDSNSYIKETPPQQSIENCQKFTICIDISLTLEQNNVYVGN